MGNIRLLSEQIANQIAAGEVVERPSSVVKELVENAVDAGSTRIDVAIEEGGLQYIRVADNGTGMEPDDCEIAFSRHATSKIATTKDLFAIRTLGFRGEALPSISAVSKLECTTSSTEDGLGRKIAIDGGTVRELSEATATRGTEMVVRELFYNTPARLKYMKSIQTELGHVSDYMYRLALAHPNIAFTLKHNGNSLMQTLGNGDIRQVIAAIYGTAVGKGMLPIQGETLDYQITGFISMPEITRANRGGITLVINGRYVRNFALNAAILQGYHTLLPINRYPIVVLHIEMDPSLIDVNVHPAKLEVRFSKEAELTQSVDQLIKETLSKKVLIPSAGTGSIPTRTKGVVIQEQMDLYRPQAGNQSDQTAPIAPKKGDVNPSLQSEVRQDRTFDKRSEPLPISYSKFPETNGITGENLPSNRFQGTMNRSAEPIRSTSPMSHRAEHSSADIRQATRALMESMPLPDEEHEKTPKFPSLSPIGQLHGTYLLAQNEQGLYMIDQHAAHERMNYEYYYYKFGNPEQASQQLLVPLTLEFTPSEAQILEQKLPQLEQVGVYLESFGGNAFIVRSYPHWLPDGEEKAIVEEMCDLLLNEKRGIDLAKFREKAAIMCSCKASIKANQNLSIAEMEALLDKLGACSNPYTCPHGRPIVVSFTTYELEKMFKRVM
ncbi:DNA mismatch repair endonuclease MutL [Paenibacillus sp. N1-5-1-14]|uniref:DNA mismatch repair endonuclease MutL n=1 Tax=Paenibacillus radicibacter TaxID=2972488 RepID=UPI0021598427|nr:DNA mismatch repair endonuclease MutL [Paenibacillus radicibacter]MCR8641622.1 DNA mismatch repair endonuclease MutL [Paenibacillus radicibacter]